MNNDRNTKLKEISLHIEIVIKELDEIYFKYVNILEEEENEYDNLSEEIQLSEKGLLAEETLNDLMEEAGNLFNIINDLRNANKNIKNATSGGYSEKKSLEGKSC